LAIVIDVVERKPAPDDQVTARAKSTRLAWANSEAAVDRSIQEPAATRIDPSQGRGLLAAAQRIVRAAQGLWIDAERGATILPFEAMDDLSTGLLTGLDNLANDFAGRPTTPMPDLRALFRAVELAIAHKNVAPSIGLHLDELVNAIDTAAHLVGLMTPEVH
jgi:hypothetical protein